MADDHKYFPDMTDEEKLAALTVLSKMENGLEEAIDLLIARKVHFDTDENEVKKIRIKLLDAQGDLAKVRSKRIALEAGQFAMKSPSAEVVAAIKKQADELDQMIASAVAADTVVDAANLLLQTWQNSQA
jgi:hypothetical protein